MSSYTQVSTQPPQETPAATIIIPDKDDNDDEIYMKEVKSNEKYIYTYQITGMRIDLNSVSQFENPLDPANMFNRDTIFHYCNILLDCYENSDLTLALFRGESDFGPDSETPADVYFHPFQWKSEWHLAIGFTKYNKILFVHCSDYILTTANATDPRPSFPTKVSLKVKHFVEFFKHKVSKHSLKYPRLYTDIFEPPTKSNGINLITAVFAFCIDPVNLIRSFCDPTFTPRKFDISDCYTIVKGIDRDFRHQLEQYKMEQKKEEEKNSHLLLIEKKLKEEKALQQKKKEERLYRKQKEEEEAVEARNKRLEEAIERKEKHERIERAKALKEVLKHQRAKEERIAFERQELRRQERERRVIERLEAKAKEDKEKADREKSITEKMEKLKQIKQLQTNVTDSSSEDENASFSQLPPNTTTTTTSTKREYEQTPSSSLGNIAKKQKPNSKPTGNSISAAIEINDLEDSDDSSEEEMEIPLKTVVPEKKKKEYEDQLKNLFVVVYAIEFRKNIYNLTLLSSSTKLDLIYKLIQEISYNSYMNPGLFQGTSDERIIRKGFFEIRDSLVVTYKRRMKQEFDESQCEKMLAEKDPSNQIIPLIFENGSIFFINIKTTDKFNCIVKLICVTNRTNRSEREIMKNYAFRRLIEMYVAKYNRLVIKIRTSIISIKYTEFYKVAMASFFMLQRILWKNKFDLVYRPKSESMDAYNVYFEKMMEGVESRDMFFTELNLKRTLKHSLSESSSS